MSISVFSTGKVKIKTRFSHGKGWVFFRKISIMLDKQFNSWWPVNVYMIDHPEGKIIIDTGETAKARYGTFYPALSRLFIKNSARFHMNEQDEIGPLLQQNNIDLKNIRWVIPTHLHQDHMDGLSHFPGSEIIVSKREYADSRKPLGSLNGYMPQHFPENFSPTIFEFRDEPIGPFKNSFCLTKDGKVRIVPVPGHTMGHIAVIYEEKGIYYLFAGDSAFSEANMLNCIADGVCMSAKTQKQTLKKIKAFAAEFPTVFLPAHDPDAEIRLKNKMIVPCFKDYENYLAGRKPVKKAAAGNV